MARSRVACIIILLFALIAVGGAAEHGPNMLSSFFARQRMNVSVMGWGGKEYSGWEYQTASFKAVEVKICDAFAFNGVPSAAYTEVVATCWHQQHERRESTTQPPVAILGEWRLDPFLTPIENPAVRQALLKGQLWGGTTDVSTSTQVTLVGKFSVHCEMYQYAEECGLEGIEEDDHVTLEGHGSLYHLENVAIPGTGTPPPLKGMEECMNSYMRTINLEWLAAGIPPIGGNSTDVPKSTSKPGSKPVGVGARAQHYYHVNPVRNPAAPTYTQGAAIVATGHVKLTSESRDLRFESGLMQVVMGVQTAEGDPAIVPTDKIHIVDPYRLDLKLRKRKSEYKY